MSQTERNNMVRLQLQKRGIENEDLLEAFRQVPREDFVLETHREMAYRDGPIPIGRGQTISQPYVVALMTEALEIEPGDRVLEIGTGSGYQAAILAEFGAEVYTIERHDSLAESALEALGEAGYGEVEVRAGDGTKGWAEEGPFDGILVTASGPRVPESLREQLAVGGHLVMPVETSTGRQKLIRLTRTDEDDYQRQELGAVAFVPLVGEEGWDEGRERTYW